MKKGTVNNYNFIKRLPTIHFMGGIFGINVKFILILIKIAILSAKFHLLRFRIISHYLLINIWYLCKCDNKSILDWVQVLKTLGWFNYIRSLNIYDGPLLARTFNLKIFAYHWSYDVR